MFLKIAKKSDIDKGAIKVFKVKGKRISIARIEDEFFAITDICTHDECSLAGGQVEGEEIICPCHGARFNIKSGQVLSLPAIRSLNTYKLKIEGSDILVELD